MHLTEPHVTTKPMGKILPGLEKWEGPEEEVAPHGTALPLATLDRCPDLEDPCVGELSPPSPEHKGQN